MPPPDIATSPENAEHAAFVHREVLQLGALILVAVAAFFLTRGVAANNRQKGLEDAAEWFRRGEARMNAGHVDEAVDAFRRAAARNRNETGYELALARALALQHDEDGARQVLLALREGAPEDPEINLQLARIAAARQDVTEALRFYHSALYAPWPSDQAEARRGARMELIRFLLAYNQSNRALSELLAMSSDLPDDLRHHMEVARLFATAGDNRHALEQFQSALRVAPENGDALAAVGQMAFQLGEYALARQYLLRAPTDAASSKETLAIADLVLSIDPLASRISSAERQRRLLANISYASHRLSACLERASGGGPANDGSAEQDQLAAFERQLTSRLPLEQETVEAGVDLIDRVEHWIIQQCAPPTPQDQALVLLGRQHGPNAQ